MDREQEFIKMVKETYFYILDKVGLKRGSFNEKAPFFIEWHNKLYALYKEKILDPEWMFNYIAFQFQNYSNYMLYKSEKKGEKWNWAIYPSTLLSKNRIRFFQTKKEEYWLYFLKQDLFEKYDCWFEDLHPELKGKETIMKEKEKPTTPTIGKSVLLSIEKAIERDRALYFNQGEKGFAFCQMEGISYSKDSEYCPTCKFKELCQKQK